MKKKIRIGSRESKLAVRQAEIVKEAVEKAHPEIEADIITMKTTGDRILDKSLASIGGKGLFVKELDKALEEKRIDLAVHSLKDIPMELADGLPILSYTKREDARDALIYRPGVSEIRKGGVIGSSSKRRMVQLQQFYPDIELTGIRGNVQTRLRKMEEEHMDGTVLAVAGLRRLGLAHLIGQIFEPWEMVPAAGQGILAIQGRAGEDAYYLDCVEDRESRYSALAERSFIRTLNGGCTSPVGAYGKVTGGKLVLTGFYANESSGKAAKAEMEGIVGEAEQLGRDLAELLMNQVKG